MNTEEDAQPTLARLRMLLRAALRLQRRQRVWLVWRDSGWSVL